MHNRQIDEVVAAHTMRDADDGPLHVLAEMIDHEEEVTRVVIPRRWSLLTNSTFIIWTAEHTVIA